jgi:alpha-tubulin suppressor-like RCC1 family protein
MTNYSKVKHVKFIVAILFLLLSVVIVISGCGGKKHSISGRITSGGSALSGVTVTLSGNASRITMTDTNGNYIFSDLSESTYIVTPSLTGYTFIPSKKSVYLNFTDATGFDFSCSGQGRLVATNHTGYLKSDGTVWTWGNNSNGQLGDGTTTDRWTPVQVQSL